MVFSIFRMVNKSVYQIITLIIVTDSVSSHDIVLVGWSACVSLSCNRKGTAYGATLGIESCTERDSHKRHNKAEKAQKGENGEKAERRQISHTPPKKTKKRG